VSNLQDVQVIANLSKHLWLYQQKSEQVFMIPHESVLMLSPKAAVVEGPLKNETEQSTITKKQNKVITNTQENKMLELSND